MKEEMIPEFTRRFEEYVSAHITREQMRPSLEIAAELKLSDITPALYGRSASVQLRSAMRQA